LPANFTAPKGAMLILPTMDNHRDKKVWGEDALEFKPERFEHENFKNIHPYAYFPFSSGPRMCPGYKYSLLAMKIFISRFIMKYRVSTNMKFEDLEYVFGLTMDFKTRPMLRVTKR
jgi:cytochrome P450 family 4